MTELSESKKEKRERKKEKKEKKEKSLIGQDESDDNDKDELEIDLNAAVPLSRKRQRLLKKGKLDLDKIAKKHPNPQPLTEDGEEPEKPSKKSKYGVWVGNLNFDTTKDDLVRFILAETEDNEGELLKIKNEDITRVNLPKKNDKSKGFAYVDLPSPQHVKTVVALSESRLLNRSLLIKDASSFEGRPEEHKDKNGKAILKNPPSRILFVGNLSFDTTDELLEEHFGPCGKITRIRMATFQDTGKCKGFAFIDFIDEEGPTNALKSKITRNFINRNLRLEYGEDRSKRNPKRMEGDEPREFEPRESGPGELIESQSEPSEREVRVERPKKAFKRPAERVHDPNKRMKSSIALATAQRQSQAIVPSQGKKVKFD